MHPPPLLLLLSSFQSLYEEAVELQTSEGVFSVSLKALFPRPALSLPNSLKFGMCAIQDSVSVNFEISNIRYVYPHEAQ